MTLFQQIDRMKYIHYLIRTEATGNPNSFAKKLNLSRRQLYYTLEEFNDLGADIKYNRIRETFYYASPFIMNIDVKIEKLNKTECKKINGGGHLSCLNTKTPFRANKLHVRVSYLLL